MATTLYSTAQAAAEIGASDRTVRRIVQLAAARGETLGTKVGRDLVLSPADVERLRAMFRGKAGNPNFVTGNRFGKPPKKVARKSKKSRSTY